MNIPTFDRRGLLAFLAVGALVATPVAAERWERLGRRDVDFRVDHDVVEVGRAEGRFRELRIEVSGAAIELFDMKVVFEHGDAFEVRKRLVFESGSWSRAIDLPGDRRTIRRVEFVYRTLREHHDRREHATVTLYGR